MFREIKQCRICGNNDLAPVLSLGVQSLTGVFPKSRKQQVTCGPLELVRCHGSHENACGLVQLKHSFDLQEMYGDNYGYRSGLNNSMVRHFQEKVHNILKRRNSKKSKNESFLYGRNRTDNAEYDKDDWP